MKIEIDFTAEEYQVIKELSAKQGLTEWGVLRQALRVYQLIATGHSKLVEVNPIPKAKEPFPNWIGY